jgi:putative superfamily III holin-X
MSTNNTRSVSQLFSDALNQLSALLRNELQLARKELSLKASEAMTAVGFLVGAGLFLVAVLVELLTALAAWMQELGTGPALAHLIAAGVGLLIVALLGGIGMNRLKANSPVPERTFNQFQQDVAAAKEHV